MRIGVVLGGVLAAALTAGACAPTAPRFAPQPVGGVTGDAGIAGAVSTANETEIVHARIALERATHPDVRAFAERVAREHATAEEKLRRMLARMRLQESAGALARQLEATANETAEVLRAVDGTVFDRTYIESQIATHEWLLRTLDESLMPAARSEDMRAQLRMVRAAGLVHLERARSVRSRLGE